MREVGGKDYFEALMAAFDKYKNEHIAVLRPGQSSAPDRLHETQSIDKFNYGVANARCAVRVPHRFVNNGYKGYLEDRRPNSQGDPLQIASRILQTNRHGAAQKGGEEIISTRGGTGARRGRKSRRFIREQPI